MSTESRLDAVLKKLEEKNDEQDFSLSGNTDDGMDHGYVVGYGQAIDDVRTAMRDENKTQEASP